MGKAPRACLEREAVGFWWRFVLFIIVGCEEEEEPEGLQGFWRSTWKEAEMGWREDRVQTWTCRDGHVRSVPRGNTESVGRCSSLEFWGEGGVRCTLWNQHSGMGEKSKHPKA